MPNPALVAQRREEFRLHHLQLIAKGGTPEQMRAWKEHVAAIEAIQAKQARTSIPVKNAVPAKAAVAQPAPPATTVALRAELCHALQEVIANGGKPTTLQKLKANLRDLQAISAQSAVDTSTHASVKEADVIRQLGSTIATWDARLQELTSHIAKGSAKKDTLKAWKQERACLQFKVSRMKNATAALAKAISSPQQAKPPVTTSVPHTQPAPTAPPQDLSSNAEKRPLPPSSNKVHTSAPVAPVSEPAAQPVNRESSHSTASTRVLPNISFNPAPPSNSRGPATGGLTISIQEASERDAFLSGSNGVPILIGMGTKQGLVVAHPTRLDAPNASRKPYGWQGSGTASIVQDGIQREVFVEVVVSIPCSTSGPTAYRSPDVDVDELDINDEAIDDVLDQDTLMLDSSNCATSRPGTPQEPPNEPSSNQGELPQVLTGLAETLGKLDIDTPEKRKAEEHVGREHKRAKTMECN